MTLAISTSNSNPPPAPRGAQWVDVKTAAERMGLTEQRVRQLAEVDWAPGGLAKLENPPGGGKARWMIREDADPALARIKFPQHLVANTGGLRAHQRAAWERDVEIYLGWEEACRQAVRDGVPLEKATALYVSRIQAERGVALDDKTLYRWRKSYRLKGAEGLIDGRWKPKDSVPANDPMLEEAGRLFLNRNGLSMQLCFEMACQKAADLGWRQWSYATTARRLRALLSPSERIYHRDGGKAFTDEAEAYIERDYSALESNELWNTDHHQFDVIVRVGDRVDTRTGEVKPIFARPWLTAWQDCRSRKIVGWIIRAGDPDTDAIILALRRAVMEHGIPKACHVDNGKDFDSFALHGRTKSERRRLRIQHDTTRLTGIFAQLTIDARNVQPYHGQSKPIERFFGTLESRFGKLWETYCGNKPENKPEGLEERLDAGKAPVLEEFIGAFAEWVEGEYNAKHHHGDSMDGQTPDAVFETNLVSKRTAPESALDVMLWKVSKPVKVTQNGVTWNGLHYGQYEPALKRLLGDRVTLRVDPGDISRVTVWTLEGRFVCAASANRKVPMRADSALLKDAIAEKRRDRKTQIQAKQSRLRLHDSLPDRMSRLAAERKAQQAIHRPHEPTPPANINPVRTPFEEQSEAVQRAMKQPALRPAAGAEGVDLLALANAELRTESRPSRPALNLATALNDDGAGLGVGHGDE